jgi:hypothetical protein
MWRGNRNCKGWWEMLNRNFTDKREALKYRDEQRQQGNAASIIDYGENKYRIRVRECTTKEDQNTYQRILSNTAWDICRDIEELTKVKKIISGKDFGNDGDYGSTLDVAKYLNREHWFKYPDDVLKFFDCPDKELDKIQNMVDEGLAEYEDQWLHPED